MLAIFPIVAVPKFRIAEDSNFQPLENHIGTTENFSNVFPVAKARVPQCLSQLQFNLRIFVAYVLHILTSLFRCKSVQSNRLRRVLAILPDGLISGNEKRHNKETFSIFSRHTKIPPNLITVGRCVFFNRQRFRPRTSIKSCKLSSAKLSRRPTKSPTPISDLPRRSPTKLLSRLFSYERQQAHRLELPLL